jgi:hypothetical protein
MIQIDSARLAELHGQGLSQGAIAKQLGCSRNSVKRQLVKARLLARPTKAPENGRAASTPPSRPKSRANGSAPAAELEAVEQALDEQWQRLSLVERLRFFLKA